MKTLLSTLRNSILTFSLILICSISFTQQESTVWLTINDTKHVPVLNASGQLIAQDVSFNEAIMSLNIKEVQKIKTIAKQELPELFDV